MTETQNQMENLCDELIAELLQEQKIDEELAPVVSSLKALNLAYEVLPEVQNLNRELVYYWIHEEVQHVKEMTVEQIVERQERHLARQDALEKLIRHETTKSKTKESALYLLIEKRLEGKTEDEKRRVRSLIKKKIKAQGKPAKDTPARARKTATKEDKAKARLKKMGFTDEQIASMT